MNLLKKHPLKVAVLILALVIIVFGYLSFVGDSYKEYVPEITNGKRLKYLQVTNSGLSGYFDNGAVVECARCDFIARNVDSLYQKEKSDSWDTTKTPRSFNEDQNNNYLRSSWVVVDYRWMEQPGQ